MRGAVYVNGTIAPADQAVVPVYDHGFVYGEGVYETLRTYNKVPFLYDRHMRRLRQSADRLMLPVPFDDATLLKWIHQTIDAAGDLTEAYIRILLTRGVGDLNYDPKSTPMPTTVIIVKPFEGVRDARFKYVKVAAQAGVTEELYDLAADPHELVNLAGEPAWASTVDQLRQRLIALRDG